MAPLSVVSDELFPIVIVWLGASMVVKSCNPELLSIASEPPVIWSEKAPWFPVTVTVPEGIIAASPSIPTIVGISPGAPPVQFVSVQLPVGVPSQVSVWSKVTKKLNPAPPF